MDERDTAKEILAIEEKKKELEIAFNQLNPLEFFIGGYKAAGGVDIPMNTKDVRKLKTLLQEFHQSIDHAQKVLNSQFSETKKEPVKMEIKKEEKSNGEEALPEHSNNPKNK